MRVSLLSLSVDGRFSRRFLGFLLFFPIVSTHVLELQAKQRHFFLERMRWGGRERTTPSASSFCFLPLRCLSASSTEPSSLCSSRYFIFSRSLSSFLLLSPSLFPPLLSRSRALCPTPPPPTTNRVTTPTPSPTSSADLAIRTPLSTPLTPTHFMAPSA